MIFEEFKQTFQKREVVELFNSKNITRLVSIIVVTYQHVQYIRQCLDSILMQVVDFEYEILLGDDDSTDGTREICIEYAKKYPDKIRLFLHSRENNINIGGQPTGRFNFMYNLFKARGKYIALCEGDDYWTDPFKLQKQIEILESKSEVSTVVHPSYVVMEGANNKKVMFSQALNEERIIEPSELTKGRIFHTNSLLFRRADITELPKGFKEFLPADKFLYWWLLKSGKIFNISDVMSVYRKHAAGLSMQDNKYEIYLNEMKMYLYLANELKQFSRLLYEAIYYESDRLLRLTKKDLRRRIYILLNLFWFGLKSRKLNFGLLFHHLIKA